MKLTGQEVFWCRNYEDAKEILSLATELGMEWSDGGIYANDPRWYDYQSHTCYNLVSGEHAPKEVYEAMGMEIVDVGKKLNEKYS